MRFLLQHLKKYVIPAKAGIQRRASARHKSLYCHRLFNFSAFYARYRSRWIPAFAGMTIAFIKTPHFLMLFLALCFLPITVSAADAVSGEVIRLEDGREVRLIGIKADSDAAKTRLQSLINGKKFLLESAGNDRYGRVAADVYAGTDKIWLQGALLRDGLSFVYPPTGSEPHLDDLLKAEHEARQAKRGIWAKAAYADLPAAEEDKIHYGSFAFVSGKVVKAERIKNFVYLNFGSDWRTDFTVAIAAHDLHFFRKADRDPLELEGKTIRVRGWVKRNFGPMITVTHPAQMEVLAESFPLPLRERK